MVKSSYRKFCSLAIVTLLLLSGITMIELSGVRAEQSNSSISSYIVRGEIRDKFGVPVDTAIVVAINENTGNATWVYAENGTYRLNLAEINGSVSVGDTIKIVCSNGVCISNKTFAVEDNSSMRIDFVLDPEEPTLSEIDNPINPEHNSSSPEIITPEFKPDLIITEFSFSDDRPAQGDKVTLTVTVTTTGLFVESFDVTFYLDQKDTQHYIASKTVTPSPLEITTEVSVIWHTTDVVGYHTIIAVADAENKIDELNETNNELSKEICILTVEFCINSTITKINQLKSFVSSILGATDAKKINNHLDKTIDELEDGLEEYNNDERELKDVIKDLHQAVDECWKAVEETTKLWDKNKLTADNAKYIINTAGEIISLILETSYVALHTPVTKDITKVGSIIVETRIQYIFEKLSSDCDKVDNKLSNALQHYQKALKALAENKDYSQEIEQGYDKLLKAKEDVQDLVGKGKITTEFGNWVTEQINNGILVFPPELSITPWDVSIATPIVKGYETTITMTVRNTGVVYAENIKVDVYEMSESVLISSYTINKLDAGASDTTTVSWTPTDSGTHDIRVVLDADNKIVEPTKVDNTVSSGTYILSSVRASATEDLYVTNESIVKDMLIYKWNGTEYDPPVAFPDYLRCNLTITSTGSLYFENSNLTFDCYLYDSQYTLQINQSGRLDVLNGSLVTASSQTLAYNFKVYGELNIKNKSEVWWTYGDRFNSPYVGGIRLYSTSICNITDSTVTEGETHNIYADGASPRIYNSTISWAGAEEGKGNGIYCVNGAAPTIEKCVVNNSKQAGIYLKDCWEEDNWEKLRLGGNNTVTGSQYGWYIDGSYLETWDNIILDCKVGIMVVGSILEVNHTTIKNASKGVYIASVYKAALKFSTMSTILGKITNCEISHSDYGAYLYDSNDIQITDTKIHNCSTGVYICHPSVDMATDTLIERCAINDSEIGLKLDRARSTTIINSTFYNNSNIGIYFWRASDNSIINTTCSRSLFGMYLSCDSNFNRIMNCTLQNNSYEAPSTNYYSGIMVDGSDYNIITNCNIYDNNRSGIIFIPGIRPGGYVAGSRYNQMVGCTVYNNLLEGIYIMFLSRWNSIESSTFHNNYCSIRTTALNATIANSTITNGVYGVAMDMGSGSSQVTNTPISGCTLGVYSYASSENAIRNCILQNDYIGMYSYRSQNIINNCDVSDGHYGFLCVESSDTIHNNTISSNTYGIYYADSDAGTITSNTITNHAKTAFDSIFTTPRLRITFYKSYGRGVYLTNANITISDDNRIFGNLYGIYSNGSSPQISNNRIWRHNSEYHIMTTERYNPFTGRWEITEHYAFIGWGIYACKDSNQYNAPVINGNYLGDNIDSIRLIESSQGLIVNNSFEFSPILAPSDRGIMYLPVVSRAIWFYVCSNINITENNIKRNHDYGIYFESCTSNKIYHNNFIDNICQAYDDGTNIWDNGYPSGGNYWNDYIGADIYSGPNQDQPGSDWIGDTPYYISGGDNKDTYPFYFPMCEVFIGVHSNSWGHPPIADAVVSVVNTSTGETTTGITDAGGFCSLLIKTGTYSITVSAVGFISKTYTLSINWVMTIYFDLSRSPVDVIITITKDGVNPFWIGSVWQPATSGVVIAETGQWGGTSAVGQDQMGIVWHVIYEAISMKYYFTADHITAYEAIPV